MNRNKATSFSENLIEIQVQKLFFGGGGKSYFWGKFRVSSLEGSFWGGGGGEGGGLLSEFALEATLTSSVV